MRQYAQTNLKTDRQVANTLAELIIGGSLASVLLSIGPGVSATFTNHNQKAGSLFENWPSALVAGAGFEPATSGLS